jgi:hypothetical protein
MVDAERQRDELVQRLFSAGLGIGEVLTVYLGDTLRSPISTTVS